MFHVKHPRRPTSVNRLSCRTHACYFLNTISRVPISICLCRLRGMATGSRHWRPVPALRISSTCPLPTQRQRQPPSFRRHSAAGISVSIPPTALAVTRSNGQSLSSSEASWSLFPSTRMPLKPQDLDTSFRNTRFLPTGSNRTT